MSRRSLAETRRYLVAALGAELALLPFGLRRGLVLAGTTVGCLFFFRDPRRDVGTDPDTVYAPADGVIVRVDTVADEWLSGAALRISTFLALYDVHVNRSPVAGRIVLTDEQAGGFAPAFLPRAGENYRKRLAIEAAGRRIVLVQIAGLVARKISSWRWQGDQVAAGERLALIHFGSRADVLAPAADVEPLVRVGQRVQAGTTPIARYLPAVVAT